MRTKVVVLGAGFGGSNDFDPLRRAGRRTRSRADRQGRLVRLRLLQARRDVRAQVPAGAGYPYRAIVKPGCASCRRWCAIDPVARRVETDAGSDADILVVALGADVDPAATPGLVEGGNEFYWSPARSGCATNCALPGRPGHRRVCGAPSVSAGPERMRAPAARLSGRAWTARASEISVVMPSASRSRRRRTRPTRSSPPSPSAAFASSRTGW